MKHKDTYKNVVKTEFNVLEVEKDSEWMLYCDDKKADYLIPIVKIENDEVKWFKGNANEKINLWVLFGKKKSNKKLDCVQVGSSNNGIKEIETDIKKLFKEEKEQDNKSERSLNTQFYTEVYSVPEDEVKHKSCYQYRKIKKDYKTLIFYKIDIDKYLNIHEKQIDNHCLQEIFNLSKPYYAETKFAFETQSIYWNSYRSGLGMDTLKKLAESLNCKKSNG